MGSGVWVGTLELSPISTAQVPSGGRGWGGKIPFLSRNFGLCSWGMMGQEGKDGHESTLRLAPRNCRSALHITHSVLTTL